MIPDKIADGAMTVLREWRNDGADGESAHLVCDYVEQVRVQRDEALAKLNTPELYDFAKAVRLEGAHQRERWGAEHDGGKAPADWFWLVGYLAGKALASHLKGDVDKALHHTITAAAAIANWNAAILGKTNMRPGIARPAGEDLLAEASETISDQLWGVWVSGGCDRDSEDGWMWGSNGPWTGPEVEARAWAAELSRMGDRIRWGHEARPLRKDQ